MKKIIVSLSMIAAVAAIAVGATTAFFSDTETSTGNTFTAGALDLKIDSTCHYYRDGVDVGCGNWGNWEETDLRDGAQKFFSFNDIKPGDWGEDTISIHVHDNDAWGWWGLTKTNDSEGTCTEPETEAQAQTNQRCEENNKPGQLGKHMTGMAWLDQGAIPGFQCKDRPRCPQDLWEGDNVWQHGVVIWPTDNHEEVAVNEPEIKSNNAVDSFFDIFTEIDLSKPLMSARATADDTHSCAATDADGDGHTAAVGEPYLACHGLARDGRLVGSTTYYIGWKWMLDPNTGNDAQTDMLGGDMWFKAVQHRNNPSPSPAI